MSKLEQYLENIEDHLDLVVDAAWSQAEEEMCMLAQEWSKNYPNHFVYITEGMGRIFMEIYRVGRGDKRLKVGDVQASMYERRGGRPSGIYPESNLEILIEPLLHLRQALIDASDKYKRAIDIHCFYQGVSLTTEQFQHLRNYGVTQADPARSQRTTV